MGACPGPNPTEETPVKSGASQIVEETGDLILSHASGRMTQSLSHRRAHAGRSHRMGTVVALDHSPWAARVRIVVESQQLRGKGTRHKQRRQGDT